MMGVGSVREGVVTVALKLFDHTEPSCWSVGSVLEERLPPFSAILVSMMTRIRRTLPAVGVTASEVGGSPLPLLGADGNLLDGEEEGTAQSH